MQLVSDYSLRAAAGIEPKRQRRPAPRMRGPLLASIREVLEAKRAALPVARPASAR